MVGGALLRNVQGWLTPAIADGKIDAYEWRRLAVTTVEVVLVSSLLHWGIGVDETVSTAIAILVDMLYSKIAGAVAAKKAKK